MELYLYLLTILVIAVAWYLLWSRFRYNQNAMLILSPDALSNKTCYYFRCLRNQGSFSTQFVNLLGWQSGQAEAQINSLKQYMTEDEYHHLSDLFQAAMNGKTDSEVKVTLIIPRLPPKYFQCSSEILYNYKAKRIGCVVFFEDISSSIASIEKFSHQIDKLKEDVHRFEKIFEALPIPVWVRDSELNIIYFNQAYSQLITYQMDSEIHSDILELDKHSKPFAQLAQQQNKLQNEQRYVVNEGKRCLFDITELPLNNTILLGFAFDITAKENIKKELERNLSAQSELLEISSSATAIYGADSRLKFFNQAFARLWQLEEKWLNGQPTYDQMLEQLREKRKLPEQANFPAFKQAQLRLFTELIEPLNEFLYLPDGRSLRVIVMPHALGGLLFSYEDMTDRLALERSYNTLIAVQKATLDNLDQAVSVFGDDGRMKLNNPVYSKMWNLDQHFLRSEPHINEILEHIKPLVEEENWENVRNEILSSVTNKSPSNSLIELRNGGIIKRKSVPLPDGAILITHIDITDTLLVERSLVERNQALQDADRIKTEFLANVSYELRSPLASIMGLSEALQKEYFGDLNKNQREYIDGIYSSSQYLMNLINDILDLASIEAGYMKLELMRFDIAKTVNAILPLFKERMKELKLKFKFVCSDNIGEMVGDELRIRQIIFKLLSNAIEFNKIGGSIRLSVSAINNDTQVVICIEDTGAGIKMEDQALVFNKFYRNKAVKSSTKSGAGLGLSVIKSFVELHGGAIILDSKEDVGTKISCILPRECHLSYNG